MVRSGPPRFWPASLGPLDELTNSAEFLVHHEDVRRAQPDWQPRAADPTRDAATWKAATQGGRLNFRKSPVGVILRMPDGREARVKTGTDPVTIVGAPMDLLLYAFGRDAVNVTFDGHESAVNSLQSAARGL
jgi:uncharacterized protein (TIGR03085 family)